MKIAVLSDIHGNRRALETVVAHVDAWQPDKVVVNGDVVNRGPYSRYCLELVRGRSAGSEWCLVKGNHEAYVASWADSALEEGETRAGIDHSSLWTYARLDGSAPDLKHLPAQVTLWGPDGSVVRCTHASMRSNRDGIYPETPPEKVRLQIAPAPAVFCTAHTHRPFVGHSEDTLVVNSGAAGTTFDGDTRASYVQLSWQRGEWRARIVRLAYDRQGAARDFAASGYLAEGGPLVKIFFYEWLLARPMITVWSKGHQEAVLAGEQTLADSVDAFLTAEVGTSEVDLGAV